MDVVYKGSECLETGEGADGGGQGVEDGCGRGGFVRARGAEGEVEGREAREKGEGGEGRNRGRRFGGAVVCRDVEFDGGEGGVMAEGVGEEGRGGWAVELAIYGEALEGRSRRAVAREA